MGVKGTAGRSGPSAKAGRWLTPASGFLAGYSHTLNPYVGCAFGCSYCYVRRMPVALFRGEEWGSWADAKRHAPESLKREIAAAKRKGPVTIFMASATDPYQPLESTERLTRSLLAVMAEPDARPDALFVQTRSPLVMRDADVLARLRDAGVALLVSVTVETDRDDIRCALTPSAPPLAARLRALRELRDRGLPTQAAVSPVLPCTEAFARRLREVVDRVTIDSFAMGDGSGGKRSERLGMGEALARLGLAAWYEPEAWRPVYDSLCAEFGADRVFVSQEGFLPPAPSRILHTEENR
ncbi:radical SAM protein [Paenibacillus thermoaerophilus]|uniref:Radical SAM protein n=1 Tax=Paenibacillus thermoaerophilus TaxID=1215385 RepID=A0ABW2UZD1_9BACL|nr:radical SAM protein [Paenibacillus thermoaerophilus]TMV15896.1 radical SAM protein [Paenibacillus thermoaerophilus]